MIRAMRCGPAMSVRMIIPVGMISPPPRPCTTRNNTSDWIDHAVPASADPTRKSAIAARKSRFVPNRPAAHRVSGMAVTSASVYPVVAH